MAPLPTLLQRANLQNLQNLSKRYYYYYDSYYTFPVGAIVGIVIVCIVIFLLIVMLCVRSRRRRSAGAIPYQPQPYRTGPNGVAIPSNGPGPYNNSYMVPSQYGPPQQQTELGSMPKDNNGPISQVPPIYSGPGTFYQSGAQDQSHIVR